MLKKLFVVTLSLIFFSVITAAQSTNPSSPTPLNGSYTGKGPSTETNYYFSFTAGPGEVSVRLDLKAKDYSTFARMEIGNDPSNLIAMANMNATTSTGPTNAVKQFSLGTKQSIRIRLTLDGNLESYTLSVTGGGGLSAAIIQADSEGTKPNAGQKVGKLTAAGPKPGSISSAGNKPKTTTLSSSGGGSNEVMLTCPTEIFYQIVPVGGWDPTLYSKKRLMFDNASVDGSTVFCTYTSNNGASKDSSILSKSMPGYVCSVYNSGQKSRILTCTQSVTAGLIKRRPEIVQEGL